MKMIYTLIVLALPFSLLAQPGTLDKSFGDNGIVIEKKYPGSIVHIALQKDGKFVAGGVGSFVNGFLLIRYTGDGIIDSSFGKNGAVITAFPNGAGYCSAVKVQTDNKIVAAGTVNDNGYIHVGLARYNIDGMPDRSFGKKGLVDFSVAPRYSAYIQDMAIQADGKIVITGYSWSNGDYVPIILRFNSDGNIDEDFGNKGEVLSVFNFPSAFSPVSLQPDGRILVGSNSSSKFMVARYLPDGSIDNSFGVSGVAKHSLGVGISAQLSSIMLQSDGNIVCGGEAVPPNTTGGMAMVRFTAGGLIDSTFGGNGQVITTFNDESSIIKLLVQKDGKIIGAGSLTPITDTAKFIVARYLPNGNIDSSFGSDGTTITLIQDQALCSDALLQANNAILLAGISNKLTYPQSSNFTFVEYNNDDLTKKQIIIKKIKHYIQTHNNVQATTLNNVFIYPNPAQNILHVEGLSANAKLTIVDFAGNVALSVQLSAFSSSYNLNIASLYAGNYLLKIEMNGEVVTRQFVK